MTRQSRGFKPDDWSIAISISGAPGEYEQEEIIRAVRSTISRLNHESVESDIKYKITVRETED